MTFVIADWSTGINILNLGLDGSDPLPFTLQVLKTVRLGAVLTRYAAGGGYDGAEIESRMRMYSICLRHSVESKGGTSAVK